jgi:hypothetical protein
MRLNLALNGAGSRVKAFRVDGTLQEDSLLKTDGRNHEIVVELE